MTDKEYYELIQPYEDAMKLLLTRLEVLLEEEVEIDGKAYYLGHSREYVKVAVPKTEKYGVNDILAVKVEKTLQPHILQGEEIQVL